MAVAAPKRMTTDEFLDWAKRQPEGQRYELCAGEVVAMSPERVSHVRIKFRVWSALRDALAKAEAPCEAFGDGLAVRIDRTTLYEPDALVRCGQRLSDDTIVIDDPLILVEVVSPSSQAQDTGAKLADYFRLPSVSHYLIVRHEHRSVIHHRRGTAGLIETRLLNTGTLTLDPPGIEVDIESFFED